jgi:hypothetical protein
LLFLLTAQVCPEVFGIGGLYHKLSRKNIKFITCHDRFFDRFDFPALALQNTFSPKAEKNINFETTIEMTKWPKES